MLTLWENTFVLFKQRRFRQACALPEPLLLAYTKYQLAADLNVHCFQKKIYSFVLEAGHRCDIIYYH